MASLEDSLRFVPGGGLAGSGSFGDPSRPAPGGVHWCTAPAATRGIVYRCTAGGELQALQINTNNTEEPPVVRYATTVGLPVVACRANDDGRLVAVALGDGSLRCYNATADNFSLRWTLPDAHSYRINDVSSSSVRAGSLNSLAFYAWSLLWVDEGGKGLQIVEADSTGCPTVQACPLPAVTCAAWCPMPASSNMTPRLTVGTTDGSLYRVDYHPERGFGPSSATPLPGLDVPEEAACTHLIWLTDDTLGAGFCQVTPSEEEDDEDDEDDSAQHEAFFYILTVNMTSWTCQKAADLGDIVSFFAVPKGGRHVFLTASVPTTSREAPLLLVACNVSSDLGVVAREDGVWHVVDVPEGQNVQAPTTDEDDFTFFAGLTCTTAERVILAATDGSLCTYQAMREGHGDYFPTLTSYPTVLPSEPLEVVSRSAVAYPLPEFSLGGSLASATAGLSLGANPTAAASAAETPFSMAAPSFSMGGTSVGAPTPSLGAPTSALFGQPTATPSPFSSGSLPSFGAGANAPAFGQTSTLGTPAVPGAPLFGQPSPLGVASSVSAFGSGGAVPTFGQTSTTFGFAANSPPGDVSSQPSSFASGSGAPVFGSSFGSSAGFSGLAKSPASAVGAASPFGAFGAKAAFTSPASAMAKPLFGLPQEPALVDKDEEERKEVIAPALDEFADDSDARKARDAYDLVDATKSASLPVDRMEDILEELGEGFYGEELDKQIALVDPNATGILQRQAFVAWYVDHVQTGTLNGEEYAEDESERAEERAKATVQFKMLSTDGGETIRASAFPNLLGNLETTYSEMGSHGRAKRKLTVDGKISLGNFTDWYIDFLFEDEDDSDDESVERDAPEANPPVTAPVPMGTTFGSQFGVAEGSWRCESCFVSNITEVLRCAACTTRKPGTEESAASSEETSSERNSTDTPGNIAFGLSHPVASRFTFAAPNQGPTEVSSGSPRSSTTRIVFGAPTEAPTAGFPLSADGGQKPSQGFSFGVPPTKQTGDTEEKSSPDASSERAPDTSKSSVCFGSGSGAPVFGFTPSSTGGFGNTDKSAPPASGQLKTSPFELFGKKSSAGAPGSSMVKPLFEKSRPVASTEQAAVSRPALVSEPVQSPAAAKARKAFDSLDLLRSGNLPADRMDALLDELGEGFHGEELDKQVALIDPEKTGQLSQQAFIDWYVRLAAGDDGDEVDSLDSDERAERSEERAKATEAFKSLSDDWVVIQASSFPSLLEKLETTYSELGSHGRAKKKLTVDGKISLDSFLDWYMDFLFGDDDDEEEEEEESLEEATGAVRDGPGDDDAGIALAPTTSSTWGSQFAVAEGTWKCEACFVSNIGQAQACVACTTTRSGAVPTSSVGAADARSAPPFGGASSGTSQPSASGFSFGVSTDSSAANAQPSASGFSFGVSTDSSATTGQPSASGFSFGVSTDSSATTGQPSASNIRFGVSTDSSANAQPSASNIRFGVSTDSSANAQPSASNIRFGVSTDSSVTAGLPIASTVVQSSSVGVGAALQTGAVTKGKSATVPKATPKAAPSSAAYPPTSATAPNPFGATTPAATPKKAAAKSPYPPTSKTAPKPFGATTPTAAPKQAAAKSPYPPTSKTAPKPFGAATPTATTNAQAFQSSNPPVFQAGTTSNSAFSTRSSHFLGASAPNQFASAPQKAQSSTAPALDDSPSGIYMKLTSRLQKSLSSSGKKVIEDLDTKEDIEEIVGFIQRNMVASEKQEDAQENVKQRAASVLARRAGIMREIGKSQRLLSSRQNAENDSVLSQPLDAQSELMQRKISASGLNLHRLLGLAKKSMALHQKLGTVAGDRALANAVLESYDRLNAFDTESIRLDGRVKAIATTASLPGESSRSLITNRATSSSSRALVEKKKVPDRRQSLLTTDASAFARLESPSTKSFTFADSSTRTSATSTQPTTSAALLERERSLDRASAVVQSRRSRNIFSPSRPIQPRRQWDEASSIDQVKARQVSFSSPQNLRETTVQEASRSALNSFGTTPEELSGVRDVSKGPPARKQRGMTKTTSAASLAVTGQEQQTGPHQTSASSVGLQMSPPSAGSSAKQLKFPSSASAEQVKSPPRVSANKRATTAMPAGPSTPDRTGNQEYAVSSLKPHGDQGTGLGSMSLLGQTSLFQPPATSPGSAASGAGGTKDYHSILTAFYQKHDPSKVEKVVALLQKYKGREVDMFAKLATKYHAANPLDDAPGSSAASASATPAAVPASGLFSSPRPPLAPSSFTGAAPSPSPFGSSVASTPMGAAAAAPSSSPFGGIPVSTPGGGAAAAPAFGNPAPAPFGAAPSSSPFVASSPGTSTFGSGNTPVFGAAAPSPSPFGNISSPFGAPAPSPFGAPSTTPTTGSGFGSRNTREMLVAFYQKYNAANLNMVDKNLAKYQGKEEQLFRALATKYKVDPAMFGLSQAAPPAAAGFGGGGGFGQPSPLGGGPSMASPFGSPAPTMPASNPPSGGGFAQFAASPSSFGAPPSGGGGFSGGSGAATGGFGALAQSPATGFGGGGFAASPSPFGTATPFGAPRR